jgi:hypothetical protein
VGRGVFVTDLGLVVPCVSLALRERLQAIHCEPQAGEVGGGGGGGGNVCCDNNAD